MVSDCGVSSALDILVPKAGFFCQICSLFYADEPSMINHCRTPLHRQNMEVPPGKTGISPQILGFRGVENSLGFGNMEYLYSVPRFWGILIPEIWPLSPRELLASMPSWEPNLGGFMGQMTFLAQVLGADPGKSLQHLLFSLLHRNSWPSSRITAGKSRAPGDGASQGTTLRGQLVPCVGISFVIWGREGASTV